MSDEIKELKSLIIALCIKSVGWSGGKDELLKFQQDIQPIYDYVSQLRLTETEAYKKGYEQAEKDLHK